MLLKNQYVLNGHTYGQSGIDFIVATLSKFYLTTTEFTMPSLKSIGKFQRV